MRSAAVSSPGPVVASTDQRSTLVRCLVVAATMIAGAMLVLVRDSVLPARFSYDAASIQAIGQGTRFVVDPAYESVAAVYRALGLIDAPTTASLLGYALACAVLLVAGRDLVRPGAPVTASILLFVAVLLAAVYLGTYSKDVFVLPIVLAAVLPGGGWRWPVLTALLIVGYALVFRTYWFLVLAGWIALQLVLARTRRPAWLAGAALAGAVVVAVAISVGTGAPADAARASSNEYRIGSADAASAILPFVPGGSIAAGIVNTPLTLISLVAPLPLALKGGAYFAVLAVALLVFWARTGIAVGRASRLPASPAQRSRLALLLAFVVVQAVFEPDYGSALRHLTPLLPIAVLLWSVPRPIRTRPMRAEARMQAPA